MKKTEKQKPEINHFFLIGGNNTGAKFTQEEARLRQAYDTLLNYVKISHTPEKDLLEVLVESRQEEDVTWIDLSPKNATIINKIEFNPQPEGKYWRTVPEELVDVDFVRDTDCVELAIGSLKYRIICKPGPKSSVDINSNIPTAYYINYKVKGGIWPDFDEGRIISPAHQIKILDNAFSALKKYADLYRLDTSGNGLSPSIRLAFEGLETLRGVGDITNVWLSYLQQGRLEHLLFKQKTIPKDRATVLGIHGGTHVCLRIGTINYNIEMTPESILDKE